MASSRAWCWSNNAPEVETRLTPGHYESDIILGAGNRFAVGVLVDHVICESQNDHISHYPTKGIDLYWSHQQLIPITRSF
jgi:hypothetical protein